MGATTANVPSNSKKSRRKWQQKTVRSTKNKLTVFLPNRIRHIPGNPEIAEDCHLSRKHGLSLPTGALLQQFTWSLQAVRLFQRENIPSACRREGLGQEIRDDYIQLVFKTTSKSHRRILHPKIQRKIAKTEVVRVLYLGKPPQIDPRQAQRPPFRPQSRCR